MLRHELDFDDVLILPQSSSVNHRGDVDLSTKIDDEFTMEIPIMAAPMRGIVGPNLINRLASFGGLGFTHRFYQHYDEYCFDIGRITTPIFGTSTHLSIPDWREQINFGAKIICIDVANGYLESVREKCEEISNYISSHGYNTYVMGGCVVTPKGCDRLYDSGCTFIRVGIGSGALCTTRNATGIGRPQISALLECGGNSDRYYVVADGGIRNSGDAAKALAAGADFLMIGTWFADTFESENTGKIYGMASQHNQLEATGQVKSIEGIELEVEKTISLQEKLDSFIWNLKSAFTYVGARTISEFQTRAELVQVSNHAIKQL